MYIYIYIYIFISGLYAIQLWRVVVFLFFFHLGYTFKIL